MTSAKALNSALLSLQVTDGPHQGQSFSLEKTSFTIGRGAENDIVLVNDPKVSRKHIKVTFKNEGVFIETLNSRNPVVFKDQFEQALELRPNDRIRLGDSEIEFRWFVEGGGKTVVAGLETIAQIHSEKTKVESESASLEEVGFPPLPGQDVASDSSDRNFLQPITGKNPVEPLSPKTPTLSSRGKAPEVRYTPTSGGLSSYFPNQSEGSASNNARVGATLRPEEPSKAKILILGLVAIVVIVGIILFSDDEKKTKKVIPLKSMEQINAQLQKSSVEVEQHKKEKRILEDGRMDRQYESAQSYYIKGFRDYRQGQYGRAMMSLQAALSFDPGHVLARKYLNQSIKKQSEIIQFHLDQARRYRMKNHFRLCRSSAQQVIIQRKDPNDPQYKDAKSLFNECDTLMKGRF